MKHLPMWIMAVLDWVTVLLMGLIYGLILRPPANIPIFWF